MKIIQENHLNQQFRCKNCGSIIELDPTDMKRFNKNGSFICPVCENRVTNEMKMTGLNSNNEIMICS